MAGFVYILCMTLSLACAVLLYRGYRQNNFRLLFWSSWGFVGFAINNLTLFIDTYILPHQDLSVLRVLPALAGMVVLVYGLITETV
jgi:hypothetical protein